ncbi:EAL domain-containing protein [Achromobacter xylosoxidans]|uniref:EAL domain-containing protein n=1 Tax=Alcaligenes xylosoxydans xylosoxydans TaxID=85698 RepID=A0A424WJP9_ALCXX|nr:EAL domain-containing protein [Achromobacter xylosoxidans]MBC9904629.1 EAL domain-containing protein [Achromobacter xylosoxidans]MBD0868171.1 EAL domain-containing protein [Achromobacter xylosoxidans]QNP85453.1 EAL domain-containing protein [Achromobacter xylosoxidans]RPJ93327.1 EAL domain-containing protein [Achromobacter xylosoxidans]
MKRAAAQCQQLGDHEVMLMAWRGNGLSVALQPQFNLLNGEMVAAECLARWKHPTMGDISPADFVPAVHRLGLDLFFFEQICRLAVDAAQALQEQGIDVPLAINASASTLVSHDAVDVLTGYAAAANIPMTRFRIELTEDQPITHLELLRKSLKKFAKAGCQVSMDDFGTGYASLQLLNALPIAELKIDGRFVRRIRRDRKAREITRLSVLLGERLGLRVIAEGIESAPDIALLQSMGCSHGQGYVLSPPVVLSEFIESRKR